MFLAISFVACDDDDSTSNAALNLSINGLENLGNDYTYEGWIIVDGNPITTGTFDVNDNGELSRTSFELNEEDLTNASTFVLTIEPRPDTDPAPSDVHILAGDFGSSTAGLTIDHQAALNNSFSAIDGKYILATPTSSETDDEYSGIWFLDLAGGSPQVGLQLPMLPAGWAYEGWAVIDGTPVTTGTFLSASVADDSSPFSGPMPGPPFPGEDFLVNAPSGLSFPTDLSGGTAVISIEPVPDNSPAPFLLKPLVGAIPSDAVDHTTYSLDANLSFPTGTATR